MQASGESAEPSAVPPAETAEDLYENAPCGYLSTLPDGTIARVNATFLAWTGYARDELVGRRRFQELLSAGGRIYHETHYAPLLRMQGTVREVALEVVRADGERMPVLVNSVLRRDAAGEPDLVRTTIFNATERRRYERELLRAREQADAAARRMSFLAATSRELDEAQTFAGRAQALVGAVTAELCDWALVEVLSEGPTTFEPMTLAATGDPGADELAATREEARAVLAGRSEPILRTRDDGASRAVLPMCARGRTLGALALGARSSERALRAEDVGFLADLADRAGLALENARLYERERDVARVLQRSLLASHSPEDPRVALATRYEPAVESLEVGGDWHDAFALADDRLGLVVGDVVGRGVVAASAMGQLRSAARALGAAGAGPAEVLEQLDAFAVGVDAAQFATVAYLELELETGTLRIASAGHPPPALVEPGSPPCFVWDGRSAPLATRLADDRRPQAELSLEPGARLVVYTDGLVERRGESIDTGLARLGRALDAGRDAPLDALVDDLVTTLAGGGGIDDDVCVLGLERRGA